MLCKLVLFWIFLLPFKINGSQSTLERTVQAIFLDRSDSKNSGGCRWLKPNAKQSRMCEKEPGLVEVLQLAKMQAIDACEAAFEFDRWNCSSIFQSNPKKSIFKKMYRETAVVYALVGASIAHAVSKGCATGNLIRCSCFNNRHKTAKFWKTIGCGDDLKQGKRVARNILDVKHIGTDQKSEIMRQDVLVGINSMGEQMREVCKCHGFSGSCTTKTCWKRLGPFHSAMGLLKKHYHHAVKRKLANTTKRAASQMLKKRMKLDRKKLLYLQKTPNLCESTVGRDCRDAENCATLCCGRGYERVERPVTSQCKCRMVNCCVVKCDTCQKNMDFFVCK